MGLNVVTLTPGSGYGDAGCEYIAGLHALGVPVTWTPTMANSAERLGWDCSCRHLHESIREPLLALWRRPLACNAILVNIPPVLLAKLLAAEITEPLNLGSSERVTINQLVDIVEEIAGFGCREVTILQPRKELTAATVTILAFKPYWAGNRARR